MFPIIYLSPISHPAKEISFKIIQGDRIYILKVVRQRLVLAQIGDNLDYIIQFGHSYLDVP